MSLQEGEYVMLMASIIFLVGIVLCSIWMFPVVEERKSRTVLLFMMIGVLATTYYLDVVVVGWFIQLILIDLYILFYAKAYEHYISYCFLQLSLLVVILIMFIVFGGAKLLMLLPILYVPAVYLLQLWLQKRRKSVLFIGISFFTIVFFYLGLEGYSYIMYGSTICLLCLIESLYNGFSQNFVKNTREFQDQVMLHHYEEVKSVYLNMRGWRHDYHNHIQTMKAYLALQYYDSIGDYLGELEKDLNTVDNLIKSGNLMVDAILNSKLSLAKSHNTSINCKATIPEKINISDIDICVMLGNLLDNAIEACDQIEEEKRFIRIYSDIVHSQFYFSVFNSATEDISFNQKNYISDKRGEHGHGMKRVKLTVDKYEGDLNLKNEPGVFASEIMIPL